MPYIKDDEKDKPPVRAGQLNYALTARALRGNGRLLAGLREVVDEYVERVFHGIVNYGTINEVIGAITCAGMEAQRRGYSPRPFELIAGDWYEEMAAPYEDLVIARNGDVYPKV